MSAVSAAVPALLLQYATAGDPINADLAHEANRLAAALDRFAATCSEYATGVDGGLADPLRDLGRSGATADQWVRHVAQGFLQADAAVVAGGAWQALRNTGQAAHAGAGAVQAALLHVQTRLATPGRQAIQVAIGLARLDAGRYAMPGLRTRWFTMLSLAPQTVGQFALLHQADWLCDQARVWVERARHWIAQSRSNIVTLWQQAQTAFGGLQLALGAGWRQFRGLSSRLAAGVIKAAKPERRLLTALAPVLLSGWHVLPATLPPALATARGDLLKRGAILGDRVTLLSLQLGRRLVGVMRALDAAALTFLQQQLRAGIMLVHTAAARLQRIGVAAVAALRGGAALAGDMLSQVVWTQLATLAFWGGLATQVGVALARNQSMVNIVLALPPGMLAVIGGGGLLAGGALVATAAALGLHGAGIALSRAGVIAAPSLPAAWLHRWFWQESMQHVDPALRSLVAGQADRTIRTVQGAAGVRLRPPDAAEPIDPQTGRRGVGLHEVFPQTHGVDAQGRYLLDPATLMDGDHALLSGYKAEQLTLAQIGRDEYLFGVTGLDLGNIGSGSPNDLNSVIRTAEGLPQTGDDYFPQVRERFLEQLAALPSGSSVHLAGHSMGAGMVMLLLNHPDVRAAVARRDIRVRSVVTYGMVRPRNATDVPAEYGATVRHYIDPDDMANWVGAGHQGYTDTFIVTDATNADPVVAHTSYDAGGKRYPDAALPFTVDPAEFRIISRGGH